MRLQRMLLASRPMMWPWTSLMYLVGLGSFSHFSVLSLTEFFLFTFPLNFYLYGLNDVYDTQSDRFNERKNNAQGIISDDTEVAFLKKMIWIPAAVFLLVAFLSKNLAHILLSCAFIMLSFIYSHKWTRIKEIPILDCLNSAAIYTIPGLIAYSLYAPLSSLSPAFFFLLLPYMGVHAMTTLVDEEADRKAGMTTIGVAFGKQATTLFTVLLFAVGAYVLREYTFLLSIFLISIFLEIFFLISKGNDEKYFRFAIGAVLLSFGMASMLYSLISAQIT